MPRPERPYRFAPRVLALERTPDAGALLALASERERPVLLDSAGGRPCRFTLLAFDPLPDELPPRASRGPGFDEARALLARLEPAGGDAPPAAFAGGFLGAFAYDLGVEGEDLSLPDEPWGLPTRVGGLYVDYLVVDHERGAATLVLGDEPGDGRARVGEREERIRAALAKPRALEPARSTGPLVRHVSSAEHRARIERAREAIAEGEIYQANLAHRFTRAVAGSAEDLYRGLRANNPGPYNAFLRFPTGAGSEAAILSASPELLLELAGGRARTRPIKGTRPRGADPARDRALAQELLASEKDRAELGMIVDLERNDLGRIAEPGSVRVHGFPTLERYAAVQHLVADVEARPRAGVDAWEVLAALFPGGSITGAPKLRAMEVIAELEGEGRGFFTGSLGFVDLRGRAAFDILIRTLLWRRSADGAGEVSFRVGGGITWSSDAEAEDRETLDKGAALAATLDGCSPVAAR